MGPNDATCHLDPGNFLFFFIHSFTIDILYIRPMQANISQQQPMQANAYQQKPTAANAGQQMISIFFIFFIYSFTINILYIRPMQANDSQHRLTHTNAYQQKPTAANASQQMVTGMGLNDVACHLGPVCFFFFFIHSFTIDILYISVHWANAGQQRSTIANKG